MDRKGCPGRESDYAVSKASKAKPVRVVHISNPTLVKASVSEFRSVVQSLTGQKRSLASAQSSPASSYASDEDSDRSHALKTAKLEDAAASDIPTACNNNNNNNNNNNSSSSTELADRDEAEHERSERHKVSAIEIHDMLSQQTFEWADGIGDNKFFGQEFLSPSFLSSDLDNLYVNLLM